MHRALREGLVRMSATRLNADTSYVYGISVPNVRANHHSVESQQYEWDRFEIGDIDMTGLPVLANHKEHMQRVGEICAYEPLHHEARVLMALDKDTFYGQFAENAVTTDFYGSMSLSHHFKTDARIAAASGANAGETSSGVAPTDVVTRKTAIEVSLCREPARPGAVVLEFCPSEKALLRQPYAYLAKFAERFKYPPPPEVPLHPSARGFVTERVALNTPPLRDYVVNQLSPLVARRLATLVDTAQFVHRNPILPPTTALNATLNEATVRMSSSTSNNAMNGASTGSTPAATPVNSNAMQLDTPTTTATSGTPASTNAPSGASTTASNSSNAMAVDTPAKSASTESSTRVDIGNSLATPSATELLATLHASNNAMKAELEAFRQRERQAREAEEQEKRRLAAEKVKESELATQTAISVIAERQKYTEDEKKKLLEATNALQTGAVRLGLPAESVQEFIAPVLETMVRASKRARQAEDEAASSALAETVRNITEQLKASKSSATMHGGMPPSQLDDRFAQSGTVSASSSSSSSVPTSSFSATTTGVSTFSRYGLSPDDISRFAPNANDGTASSTQEGRVDASRGAMTAGRGNSAVDDIKPDDPDAIGKVYASLCKVNDDGTISLPSYEEVACGGITVQGRVKRSANGDEVHYNVVAPRWPDKKKIGLQHLFPGEFNKMLEPLNSYDARLDESALKKMVTIGKGHAAMSVIPPITSRRRKGSYQKDFVYCDPRRKGTEAASFIDIPPAEYFADGTPCL